MTNHPQKDQECRPEEDFPYSANYDDALLAELYDQQETDSEDVALLLRLIGGLGGLRILEPFSGTGRILVPLVEAGHDVTGIELAAAMNERAAARIAELPMECRRRTHLRVEDVLTCDWGTGYDVVVLGGNAMYELPSEEAQRLCIRRAAEALRPGGYLYIDNNDYQGGWEDGPFHEPWSVIEGTGEGGAHGRLEMVMLSFDTEPRVLHMERRWTVRSPDGRERTRAYQARKRPVTSAEVRTWLSENSLVIHHAFADHRGTLHTGASQRAVFWVGKPLG